MAEDNIDIEQMHREFNQFWELKKKNRFKEVELDKIGDISWSKNLGRLKKEVVDSVRSDEAPLDI